MDEKDGDYKEKENLFLPKILRVFISYNEEDKKLAKKIKEGLNHYGIQAFLAHDDIDPSKQWPDEILKNLRQADVFIALISKNFEKSEWTDQETGIAISLSKLILPISIDGTLPYGFMKDCQAFKNFKYEPAPDLRDRFDSKDRSYREYVVSREEITKIIRFIANNDKYEFKEIIKDSLIFNLANISSFRSAEEYCSFLMSFAPFSKEQINQIIIKSIENNQVYDAVGCKKLLNKLIKEYEKLIIPKNKDKIIELINK